MSSPEQWDVCVLTDQRWLAPRLPDDYAGNILKEDGLVVDALRARGLRVQRMAWDQSFDWRDTRIALLRTVWDYVPRLAEFTPWLEHASSSCKLINPPELVRWNIDKRYLIDLSRRNLPLVQTMVFEPGQQFDLAAVMAEADWSEAVAKPLISASGRDTYRIHRDQAGQQQSMLDDLLAREAILLQPFVPSILETGELSLMVINGSFTHAVLKTAKAGEFRVQDDHGGSVDEYAATPSQIALAEKVVAACDPMPSYARVDLVQVGDNQWQLMELELIEPEMFFRFKPDAANALADCLIAGLPA